MWDLFWGVHITPAEALGRVARRRPLGLSLLALYVGSLLGAGGLGVAKIGGFGGSFPFPKGWGPWAIVVGAIFLAPAFWFMVAGLLHMASEFMGGEGTGWSVATALGFAWLPLLWLLPFSLLCLAVKGAAPIWAVKALWFLLLLGVLAWTLILTVVAVREAHRFGTGKAVAAVCWSVGVIAFVAVTVILIQAVSG
ncbi:MAG TPA: hypothetical protein EYP65_05710 [Armatimonadetes bacterium]|nr:hypothetical protein [Armatimonadota bacterium]